MNEMIITDSQRVVEITCDQDVTVPDDGRAYHATDLIYFAASKKPSAHLEGSVPSGKRFNVKVLAVVTELPEELKETEIDEVSKPSS